MGKLGKLSRPLVIKLSHLGNVVLPMNGIEGELPLSAGIVFMEGSNHYGFMIIVDRENSQDEQVYRTDHEISGIGISNNEVTIFERDIIKPWRFDQKGRLIDENKPTIDFGNYVNEITEIEPDKKISEQTITLVIENDPQNNHIEYKGEKFDRVNGLVVSGEIYGIAVKNNASGEVEKIPTEGKLFGAGSDGALKYGFQVIEDGKYHPWRFDKKGRVISEASYNPNSRKDQEHYFNKYHKKLTLEKESNEE